MSERARGRPTKLNPEREAQIADRLRAGCTRKAASESVGIEQQTFCDWMNAGAAAKSGPFYEFSQSVMRAEAEAEARNTALLEKAATEDWRAALEWLKRRRRDDWGDAVRAEVTGAGGGPIEITYVNDWRSSIAEELDPVRLREPDHTPALPAPRPTNGKA